MSLTRTTDPVELRGTAYPEVLTAEALQLLVSLHRDFEQRRRDVLEERNKRSARLEAGLPLEFLEDSAGVRESAWTVAPAPPILRDRRVEITGPVDAKMMINALNSGATGFMADFEDSNTPTWENTMTGQVNLRAAVRGALTFTSDGGKDYRLQDQTATLMVRPRGWHMTDRHLCIDGSPISASLLDAALFVFHNGPTLATQGKGPFFYLPKLESHVEARLWNDVFKALEGAMSIPMGTIKATVLIETLPAVFEMDEILYELRDHAAGLNAGRWDYLFSAIKTYKHRSDFILPDRNSVTMTAPFMRAYTELLVQTCHRRGVHAIGGMAAFIPSRNDAEVNRLAVERVREDKRREALAGFDGTWVAHPDLIAVARSEFDSVLHGRVNQLEVQRQDVSISAGDLLDFSSAGSQFTAEGLRDNVSVTLQYLAHWLAGTGAVAINSLMEDAATAEIARAQVWQWIRNGAVLDDGSTVNESLVREVLKAEMQSLQTKYASGEMQSRLEDARAIFEQASFAEELPDFLTVLAYDKLA